MNRSETIGALAGALAKAQGQIRGAIKDSTNPHFKSRYADLASIWQACREPLASNGLSVVQLPTDTDQPASIGLITILMHESGEYIESMYSAPLAQNNPQAVGSALTYLRRYALAACVGVAPDDDDDGNSSSQPSGKSEPARYSPPVQPQQPDQEIVKAKLAFLAFASEQIGKPIRSWQDALNWWGTQYSEPQTVEEWRASGSALRAEVKARSAKPAALSDEYDAIDATAKNGATKAIAK
jgi:hypothetical protein